MNKLPIEQQLLHAIFLAESTENQSGLVKRCKDVVLQDPRNSALLQLAFSACNKNVGLIEIKDIVEYATKEGVLNRCGGAAYLADIAIADPAYTFDQLLIILSPVSNWQLPPTPRYTSIIELVQGNAKYIPTDAIQLDVLYKLAQVCSLYRLSAEYEGHKTFANLYAMKFMPSGAGKDRSLSIIDELIMPPFKRGFAELLRTYRAKRDDQVLQEASERLTNAAKDNYYERNRSRNLAPVIADATVEGLYEARLHHMYAGFGGTTLLISEFVDYLTASVSGNQAKAALLTSIIEIYEDGNSAPKTIKSDKDVEEIIGVPSNVMAHSSTRGLSDGRVKGRLDRIFASGAARRFLIYATDKSVIENTYEISNVQASTELTDKVRGYIADMLLSHDRGLTKLRLSAEASFQLKVYEVDNRATASEVRDESIAASLTSLHRKALKIATIIHSLENPFDEVIQIDMIRLAINITNYYHMSFVKLIGKLDGDPISELDEYLAQNVGVKYSRTDLRNLRLVNDNAFKRFIDGAIDELPALAELRGYAFVKHGKTRISYEKILTN